MAISFVNQASAAATSVTLPTGILAGDLILLFAYSNIAASPSIPTGYANISTQNANSNGMRVAFKIAAGTESGTTSPASTSATIVIAAIYRGASTAVGGAGSSTNAASTSDAITGIGTFTVTSGTSWAVSYSGSAQATSMSTPASTTSRTSFTGTGQMAILVDSNAGVSAWGQHTSTLGASAVSAGGSVELLAASVTLAATPVEVDSAAIDTTTLTTPSFTPATGEIIVLKGQTEDTTHTMGTPSATANTITWTKQVENLVASKTYGVIWTGTVTTGGSACTVSMPATGTAGWHAIVMERWLGGQIAPTPATGSTRGSGTATSTITTTGANSIVSWLDGDWAANAPTGVTYSGSAVQDGLQNKSTGNYVGYFAYQTALAAGSQTYGVTNPGTQTYNLLALEIQVAGTANVVAHRLTLIGVGV